MLSCHATTKGCPSGPGDPARGPRARMCETMGFDRGGFSIDVAAGRENGHDVRGRKKMISASARSRRMMIKVLKSPTPTSHSEVPSISRPAYRNMPNEVGLDQTTPSFTKDYVRKFKERCQHFPRHHAFFKYQKLPRYF